MKVYCAGAMRGDTKYQQAFHKIIKIVESLEHEVLSELAAGYEGSIGNDTDIYVRDVKWLDESEIMIAELSGPSLGVGYELAYALHVRQIPVLGLYTTSKISAMVSGNTNPKLKLHFYKNLNDLEELIRSFIERISI